MSNRTDFDTVAIELQRFFGCSDVLRDRIAVELHDAFVAGQEARSQTPTITDIPGVDELRAEVARLKADNLERHRAYGDCNGRRLAAESAHDKMLLKCRELIGQRDAEKVRADAAEKSKQYILEGKTREVEEMLAGLNAQLRRAEKAEADLAQRDRRIAELEVHVAKAARVAAQALGTIEWFYRNKDSISPDSLVGDELREIAALSAPAIPATAGHIPGQVCEGGCSMKCVKKPGVSLDSHSKETK